ncbi:MAG TPA: response regulator transcription factor [Thermoanaerobaculia bacterium]
MKGRILVVEDERRTAEALELYLRAEGYEVRIAADGVTGLAEAQSGDYDLVLLDLMLPGMYGMDVCRRLREESGVAVIMLTARTLEDDQVRGLDAGADDYITKPFSPRQVMARVRSILRRRGRPAGDFVSVADLMLDVRSLRATIDGRPVDLTRTEARILRALIEASGRSLTRDEILDRAFEEDLDVTARSVDSHVKNLRRKLAGARAKIVTTHGIGYRLSAGGTDA